MTHIAATAATPRAAVPRLRSMLSLGCIALTLALAYGSWYAYSVFLVALLKEFGWSRAMLGGAFSLFAIMQGVTNPTLGFLCDRVRPPALVAGGSIALGAALWSNSWVSQPWHLYVTFGLCTAVAVGVCGWVPAVVQVQRRFQHRMGLALGIVSSGVGVGMLVIVPLCQKLIELYGWRTAFQALGVICVTIILPSALFLLRETPPLPPPAPKVAANAGGGAGADVTLRQAVATLPFWLMVTIYFCGNIASQTLHVHQVAFLVDHDIAPMVAATVVSVVGFSSIIGKTGSGWLSDVFEREVVYVCGIAILVGAAGALVLVGKYPSAYGAYLYAAMLGVGYSVTAALTPAMVADRFKGRHFGAIVGVGLLGSAAGSALGPWQAGYLHDLTGSYSASLAIAGGCGMVAGSAGWIARRLRRRAAAAALS